jgi:diguanylate cyclase (GGDEF)-like protein/PAS domain S-box-containing protein
MNENLITKINEIDAGFNKETPETKSEIVELLYKDTNKSSIGAFIVAIVLLYVLKDAISSKAAATWAVLMLATYLFRFYIAALFFKDTARAQNTSTWLVRYNLYTAICGLAWGSASYLIYPSSQQLQTFLVFVLGGICAGSIIAYSIKSSTAISFVSAIILLALPVFLNDGSPNSKEMMLLSGFFITFVAIVSKRLAHDLLSNLSMRINVEKQKKEIVDLSRLQNLHMEHTPVGVIEWNANLSITSWNKACNNIFGYSKDEAIGKHISFLMPDLAHNSEHKIEQLTHYQEEAATNLKKITHKNGESIFVEWMNTALKDDNAELIGMASLVQDKTSLIKTQHKIQQLAYHDPLTNLPNRGLLTDRLNQTILASNRSGSYAMIAYIDLDHFKSINDSKGHAAGDHLLITVANRLQSAVRKQDTVARMGGDEFVVVLADIGKTNKDAYTFSQHILEKIHQAVKVTVDYDGSQHRCSGSIGVCLFTGNNLSADELLRRADISMYLAKKQGRDNHQYYDETMQPKFDFQQELKNDLSIALVGNQFQLYLQSQFNKARKAVGAEALLRWHHPKYGFIMPNDFIPLAEESGLIVPIGNWVINEACALLKKWEASTATKDLNLSINISAVQFNHPNFINDMESAIRDSKCDATRLCIELTESSVVNSIEDIVYKMNYLSSMGISLSIDDFGIGYSSLSILKRLPLNEIKIDKSFVSDIALGNLEGTIAQTIVQLGKNLNLRIVAEGVETDHQMDYLRDNGCKIFQGYLVHKPCSIADFEKML